MNKIKKFETFLESLKGQGQDSLIESVKKGFKACFESFNEESMKDAILNWTRGADNPVTNPFPLGQLLAGTTSRDSGIFKMKRGPKLYYYIQRHKWDDETKTLNELESPIVTLEPA